MTLRQPIPWRQHTCNHLLLISLAFFSPLLHLLLSPLQMVHLPLYSFSRTPPLPSRFSSPDDAPPSLSFPGSFNSFLLSPGCPHLPPLAPEVPLGDLFPFACVPLCLMSSVQDPLCPCTLYSHSSAHTPSVPVTPAFSIATTPPSLPSRGTEEWTLKLFPTFLQRCGT